MCYLDVITVFGHSLAWSRHFRLSKWNVWLQTLDKEYNVLYTYMVSFSMVKTFSSDKMKSGKLDPLLYGAIFTFSIKNLFH